MTGLKAIATMLLAGCMAAADPGAQATTLTVYEFYNAASNHYFRTAEPAEATAIDQGAAGPGWVRTGDNFLAYASGCAPPGAIYVCRFYGSISPGPNSYFYTAAIPEWVLAECRLNSASAAIDARDTAAGASAMNAAGSNPLKPTGFTFRARATAMTSRPRRSKTAKRAGSAKFPC